MPKYWCVNRPPGYAQIPDGWSNYEVWMPARKVGKWFFLGWVEYPERLTREQIWQYELRPESEIERAENVLAADDSHYVQDYQAFSDEDLEEYADRDLLAWATLVLRRAEREAASEPHSLADLGTHIHDAE